MPEATVNTDSGGGVTSGSGRGQPDTHGAAKGSGAASPARARAPS